MTKKVIIFVSLLLFLNSVIVPNFASGFYPESSLRISDSVGWGLVAGCLIVLGIAYYYSKSQKESKEEKKENKSTKKKIDEHITPSGKLVLLKW